MHPLLKEFLEEPGLTVTEKQTVLRRTLFPLIQRVTKFLKTTNHKPRKEWLMVDGSYGYEASDVPKLGDEKN